MSDKPRGPVSERFMRHHYGASGLNIENAGAPPEAHGPNEQETPVSPPLQGAALPSDYEALRRDRDMLALRVHEFERAQERRMRAAQSATPPPAAPVQPVALPPLTDVMYHACSGNEYEFSAGGPETVIGYLTDDMLDDIWEQINTALRVSAAPPVPQAVQEPAMLGPRCIECNGRVYWRCPACKINNSHEVSPVDAVPVPPWCRRLVNVALDVTAWDWSGNDDDCVADMRRLAEVADRADSELRLLATAAVPVGVVEALRELVAVKDLKESLPELAGRASAKPYIQGEADYHRRKPIAWDNARAALAACDATQKPKEMTP